MIDCWHDPVVRLSVCPYVVRPSVTLCIVAFRVSVYRAKVVPACSKQASFYLSVQTLLPQNAPGKKQAEENANVSYFERHRKSRVHWFSARYLAYTANFARHALVD